MLTLSIIIYKAIPFKILPQNKAEFKESGLDIYHLTTDDLLLLDKKYTQFFKIKDGDHEITMSYECCMIYDALLNGIDLKNKESYILDYEPKNIFCNEDIFGNLYSDIELFYRRNLFNELVEKSLNFYNTERCDKIQESLKVIYIKKSIGLLNDFLNIIEDIIDNQHEKHDCKYFVLSTKMQQSLSKAILKKCIELKDDKKALQYLSYHKQYINSTLNGYKEYLLQLPYMKELSEKNIQPRYPRSIFLQNENIQLGESNFIDLTNFAHNIKYKSCISKGKDCFDIFIDYSQKILAHKEVIDHIDRKILKSIAEKCLNEFCRAIEIPGFLVDIICSKDFTEMINHEEVKRKATSILDEISQRTENDITYSEFESDSKLYGISEHTENITDGSTLSHYDFESFSHSSPLGSDQDSSPSENEKKCSIVQDHGSSDDKSKENIVDPVKPDDCMPCTQFNIRNLKDQDISCKGCCVIL